MTGIAMAVAASGGPAFTSVSDSGDVFSSGILPPTITAGPCVATPVGGTAPFSHSWSKVSGGAISADSPTSDTTTFTANAMGAGENRNALFKDTVTDVYGIVKATRNITVDITAA